MAGGARFARMQTNRASDEKRGPGDRKALRWSARWRGRWRASVAQGRHAARRERETKGHLVLRPLGLSEKGKGRRAPRAPPKPRTMRHARLLSAGSLATSAPHPDILQ